MKFEGNPFGDVKSLGEGSDQKKSAQRNRRVLIGAAAIAASSAIHAPFAPGVMEKYQEMKAELARVKIRPQSDAERNAVVHRVEGRKKLVNPEALRSFKESVAQKLEKGEDVDPLDLVFEMEEKNGVPHEQVEQARRAAKADVAKYVALFGADLDPSELDRFSREMFAKAEYVWGQASVTDYYTQKKRNCVAIARVQQIVLDAVIRRMSPETQKSWSLGSAFLQQHEVFVASELESQTQKEKTLWRIEGGAFAISDAEKVGIGVIQMNDVKKALVSSAPVEVKANQGDGKTAIDKGVEVDAVTDEPAKLNVHINGKLRGSEWNVDQLNREGHKVAPINIPYMHEQGVMELTLLEPVSAEEARRVLLGLESLAVPPGGRAVASPPKDRSLSVEAVKVMNAGSPKFVYRYSTANVTNVEPEVIGEIFSAPFPEIGIFLDTVDSLSDELIQGIEISAKKGHRLSGTLDLALLEVRMGTDVKVAETPEQLRRLMKLLQGTPIADEIDLNGFRIDYAEAAIIVESNYPIVGISLSDSRRGFSKEDREKIQRILEMLLLSKNKVLLQDYNMLLTLFSEEILSGPFIPVTKTFRNSGDAYASVLNTLKLLRNNLLATNFGGVEPSAFMRAAASPELRRRLELFDEKTTEFKALQRAEGYGK